MLETARNRLQNRNVVVGNCFVSEVNPREDGEEDDDECGSEGHGEEGDLLDNGVSSFLFDSSEDEANDVKEDETAEAEGSVSLGIWKMFECVDDDTVCSTSSAVTKSN